MVSTAPTITNSINPTISKLVKTRPRTHQRKARNNTPDVIPMIINDSPSMTVYCSSHHINVVKPMIQPTCSPSINRIPIYSPNIIPKKQSTVWARKYGRKIRSTGYQMNSWHPVPLPLPRTTKMQTLQFLCSGHTPGHWWDNCKVPEACQRPCHMSNMV